MTPNRLIKLAGAIFFALSLQACHSTAFKPQSSEQSSQASREYGSSESEVTEAVGALSQPALNLEMSCDYPEYPRAGEPAAACYPGEYSTSVGAANSSTGSTYQFSIYNALNESHGTSVLAAQGLIGERYITYQNVLIQPGLPANSVDLVLKSYEPVRWIILGNVEAVRSVRATGYHCALVRGVAPAKVAIATLEQGTSNNFDSLPLSTNVVRSQSIYAGSCLPNRSFVVE